jgi:hypothetical protein
MGSNISQSLKNVSWTVRTTYAISAFTVQILYMCYPTMNAMPARVKIRYHLEGIDLAMIHVLSNSHSLRADAIASVAARSDAFRFQLHSMPPLDLLLQYLIHKLMLLDHAHTIKLRSLDLDAVHRTAATGYVLDLANSVSNYLSTISGNSAVDMS